MIENGRGIAIASANGIAIGTVTGTETGTVKGTAKGIATETETFYEARRQSQPLRGLLGCIRNHLKNN